MDASSKMILLRCIHKDYIEKFPGVKDNFRKGDSLYSRSPTIRTRVEKILFLPRNSLEIEF